jgi:hypothetical protein
MTNKVADQFDVARLGTIPHGDSVLALGTSDFATQPIKIPNPSGLPIGLPGGGGDVNAPIDPARPGYLDPYRHFHQNPFMGGVTTPGFPGFEPVDPLNLLRQGLSGLNINRTMVLDFDSTVQSGGILNIPFVIAEANPTEMRSIFWIHELNDLDQNGRRKLVMQYAQIVMLEFFPKGNGQPGLIKWPHVSINTMEKVSEEVQPLADIVETLPQTFAPRSLI